MEFNRIKEIIDDWDPIGLLNHAPSDEYNFEIQKITDSLLSGMNEFELGTIIYNVFNDSFGEDTFLKSISDCNIIARQMLSK